MAGITQAGITFSTTGIQSGMVIIPESKVYRDADGNPRSYRQGDRIPQLEAEQFGIVAPAEIPVDTVLPMQDTELGEHYAKCLGAAGYSLIKGSDLTEGELLSADPAESGEYFADSLRAAGYDLTKTPGSSAAGEQKSDPPAETKPDNAETTQDDPPAADKQDAAEQTKTDPPAANKKK